MDGIAGLIERLLKGAHDTVSWHELCAEAATQLNALQARVKELENDAIQQEYNRLEWIKRAEAEKARATRLQQKLDEAYERAEKIITSWWAKNHPPVMKRNSELERAIAEILTAIRRLSGPEKEKS